MIARRCDGCGVHIETELFYDLCVFARYTGEEDDGDPIEQAYGDFCAQCFKDGRAGSSLYELLTNRDGADGGARDDPDKPVKRPFPLKPSAGKSSTH